MTLKHTKKTCQNGALGVALTIAMGRPDDLAITPAEVLVVRIEDDPRVFLGGRIASHEVDPVGKGLPRRSSGLELSGPHHWYKGSQPSPRSAVLSGRHVGRAVHSRPLNDPLHVAVEDPIVVRAVEIIHCVVARSTQVAGGISILPVLVADLDGRKARALEGVFSTTTRVLCIHFEPRSKTYCPADS